MAVRASSHRGPLIAGAAIAVIAAVAIWVWVVHTRTSRHGGESRPVATRASVDAGAASGAGAIQVATLADAAAPDAPTRPAGRTLPVGHGVTVIVPPGYDSATLDDEDVSMSDSRDVKLVVSVRTDGEVAKLTEAKQAALDYASQNGLELTSLVMRAPGRMVAQYQATANGVEVHHALIIMTAPQMRVAALLIVSGVVASDPSTARLIDELADGRIALPAAPTP